MIKKIAIIVILLLLNSLAVSALSASEAKIEWLDAKVVSKEKQEIHRDAKVDYAADKTVENEQEVIDTGKEVMHAALDEAEAWLIWKELEAQENPFVPDDLKEDISNDVDKNLDTVDELRDDVDNIKTQLEMGLVFLKMIGKYAELLTDVARNSGMMWVHIGNTHLETMEEYEQKLRDATDDEDALEYLDEAKEDLEEAKRNIDKAEESYEEVVLPGTPLIKFAEGNNYLRTAKTNLLSAHSNLNKALREIGE
jgi:hypothetical protein